MIYKILKFSIYFLLIENVINTSLSIELPFKKEISIYKEELILSEYNSDIYTSFQLGDQKQKYQKVFIKSDTNEFMLSNSSSINNINYNPELSSTSKKINYLRSYSLKYTTKAFVFKDTFYFMNSENKQLTKFDNLTFLYDIKNKNENCPGIIGLKIARDEIKNVKEFPCQFHELKYTKSSTWMIKYTNDEEGYFYIGDIFNKNIFPDFNFEKYRKTNAVIYNTYLSWDLTFSQIKSNDIILNGPLQANLDFNFGLISCSKEYYNHIKNMFFSNYIQQGKCNEIFYNKENINNKIKINSNFTYIVCDKSIDIKKYPELTFHHSAIDYIFKLTYKDVFAESNDKIYHLIINETEKNDRWKFGKLFFKKYNLIFDQNAKTIGIYDDNYSKSKKALIIFEWILVVILILFLIFSAYTLIKRYRLNNYKFFSKKSKADELEENYDEFFENKTEIKNINMEAEQKENKIIDDN